MDLLFYLRARPHLETLSPHLLATFSVSACFSSRLLGINSRLAGCKKQRLCDDLVDHDNVGERGSRAYMSEEVDDGDDD